MKPLKDKSNSKQPDYTYPFGDVVDKTAIVEGNELNREMFGDIMQLAEKIIYESGVTPNGLPDNEDNGFQIWEALKKIFGTTFFNGVDVLGGSISDPGSGATITMEDGISPYVISANVGAKRGYISGVAKLPVTSAGIATELNGYANYYIDIPLIADLLPDMSNSSNHAGVCIVQQNPTFTTEAIKVGEVVMTSTGVRIFLANGFNGYTVLNGDTFYIHFSASYAVQ